MSSLAQLSVRFKAFDHNCLVRAQKQLQSALSLCRPGADASVRPLDSKSAFGSAYLNEEHERGLQATGFGFLDANPKASLDAFLNFMRDVAQDPERRYLIVMLICTLRSSICLMHSFRHSVPGRQGRKMLF